MAKHGIEGMFVGTPSLEGSGEGIAALGRQLKRAKPIEADGVNMFKFRGGKKRRKNRKKNRWGRSPDPGPAPVDPMSDLLAGLLSKAHIGSEIPETTTEELQSFALDDKDTFVPAGQLPEGARAALFSVFGKPVAGIDTRTLEPKERALLRFMVQNERERQMNERSKKPQK
jgi:hypothetical protein